MWPKRHYRLRRPPIYNNDGTITIVLTKGKTSFIDTIDCDLSDMPWYTYGTPEPCAARGKNAIESKILLHRVIAERIIGRSLVFGEVVDHADGDRLNNRRDNLRVTSITLNLDNQRKREGTSSAFKGVTWNKACQKWQAFIKKNGKGYHLGVYNTQEDAHEAYCRKAIELFGEFARFK